MDGLEAQQMTHQMFGEQSSSVLITGATGFVGSALVEELRRRRRPFLGGSRTGNGLGLIRTPQLDGAAEWRRCLGGIDRIIHAAAHVHVPNSGDQSAFHRVNTDGTLRLATQAAECGVRRFVFVSTIGVNGTSSEHPFCEEQLPEPEDAYAVSKWSAEKGLVEIGCRTGMEIVILRPTMIYGHDAPGNFRTLKRAILSGVPLPLGAFNNPRALLGLSNMVEATCIALDHPGAANQVFVVSDSEALTVAELCRLMARILGRPSRLVSWSPTLLEHVAGVVGFGERIRRLSATMLVDCTKAKNVLGWVPRLSIEAGLRDALRIGGETGGRV